MGRARLSGTPGPHLGPRTRDGREMSSAMCSRQPLAASLSTMMTHEENTPPFAAATAAACSSKPIFSRPATLSCPLHSSYRPRLNQSVVR